MPGWSRSSPTRSNLISWSRAHAELGRRWVNDYSFRKQTPVGKIQYEDEMGFGPAIMMIDVQGAHATKAALPSPRFPGEEGTYFNQGEKSGTTEQFFTIAALIESALPRTVVVPRLTPSGAAFEIPIPTDLDPAVAYIGQTVFGYRD